LVTKKDGSVRVCVDYRRLNDATVTDAYPTPRVDNVIQALDGQVFFTTLDCEKGYYQLKISERTKQITAFTCPMGQFRWTRLPFGLKNAPAIFQRMMDMVLSGLTWRSCMVFFDDVVVFSDAWEKHLIDLDHVFGRLEQAGMTLNFKKCEIAQREIVYLGYLISQKGVRPNPQKTKAVREFPRPRTVAEVRTFLGISSYFRRFIKSYAQIAKPLCDLLRSGTGKARDKTGVESLWTQDHELSSKR
jgi:hypothetical protein